MRLVLGDVSATTCPGCGMRCGARIVAFAGVNKWWGTLFQIAVSSIFMLVFGFPRIMIPIFAGLIVLAAALAVHLQARAAVAKRRAPQVSTSHPVLFRVLGLGVALCTFALVAILLFGFVIFMNSWSRWQQYSGAPYHRSDFQVTRTYYQTHTRSGPDVYASGTVDGNREWMNLLPYLHTRPQDEAELDERVPVGTSIPVCLFPGLKSRSRVQVYNVVPPAEMYHRSARPP